MHRHGPPFPEMHGYPHSWGGGFGWGQAPGPEPSMLLSALSTIFWIALFLVIAWALLRWIFPYVKPIIADCLDRTPAGLAALDRLRERYADGEIDAQTFARMRERLVASYEPKDIRPDESARMRESWGSHRELLSTPVSYEQVGMMEQKQYLPDGK